MPVSYSSCKPQRDRGWFFYKRTNCLNSSKRALLAQFIHCHQSPAPLSVCFVIFNTNRLSSGAHFYTSSSSKLYRAGCCQLHHELSSDCQGIEAPTTTRNQSFFCRRKVPLFFLRNAHSNPRASPSDVRLTSRSWGPRVSEQGLDKFWRSLATNFGIWSWYAKKASKQLSGALYLSNSWHVWARMRLLRDPLDSE